MGQKMPVVRIDLSSCPSNPAWYTVVTQYNYEKKYASDLKTAIVNAGLGDKIIDIVVPIKETEYTTILKSGKESKKVKVEKIMPLYVFIKAIMDEQVWDILRTTTGAQTVLAAGGCPSIMSDKDIYKIKEACGFIDKPKVEFNGEIGDAVEIIDGALKGFTGTVKDLRNNKAKIELVDNGLIVEIETKDLIVI